jgi:hypothetical protein
VVRQRRPARRRRRADPCLALALALAVPLAVSSPVARAATTCAAPQGADPRLQTIDARQRLAWIDQRLTQVGAQARWWAWAWGGGIGASGVASLIAVPLVSPDSRVDWYVSAGEAAVGVIPFLVAPLAVISGAPKLHAAVTAAPLFGADHDAALCALLADAEQKLAAGAQDEELQQRWWIHAGNVLFNTGVVLFLGLGFHHWSAGIANGLAGAAVGEAIIFTQPTGTVDDLAAYLRGHLDGGTGAGEHAAAWGWFYQAMF